MYPIIIDSKPLKGSNRITLDHNANPSSMNASIVAFLKNKKNKSCVILGDMFELGRFTPTAHQEILDKLESLTSIA